MISVRTNALAAALTDQAREALEQMWRDPVIHLAAEHTARAKPVTAETAMARRYAGAYLHVRSSDS